MKRLKTVGRRSMESLETLILHELTDLESEGSSLIPHFTKRRWRGCSPGWTSACRPTMSWNRSPRRCWCRRPRRRRAGCWAAGQSCSSAWSRTENRVRASGTDALPSPGLATHLISLRRPLSWFCSCSLASCCSSSSLCNFFLACSSRSISSSASSIWRFKAFRRRFSFMETNSPGHRKARDKTHPRVHKALSWEQSHTWSFWSSKELCSSSPCIIVSFTFLSSLRLAICRLARSLQHEENMTFFISQPCLWTYEQTLHSSAGAQTSVLHRRPGSCCLNSEAVLSDIITARC